jgi:transaldolase
VTVLKFFIDTADIDDIRRVAAMGVLSGVTTNHRMFAKRPKSAVEVLQDIAGVVDGPIVVEVVSLDAVGMVEEALSLAAIHKNIIIKVPMTIEGMKAVHRLAAQGVRTAVTLIFSANQALLAARAGAAFVSPFIGRLDDISVDGVELIAEIGRIFGIHGIATEVIAASIRHPIHVSQAAKAGAHIATLPYLVFEQMVKHPLTDRGIERYLADWDTLQKG